MRILLRLAALLALAALLGWLFLQESPTGPEAPPTSTGATGTPVAVAPPPAGATTGTREAPPVPTAGPRPEKEGSGRFHLPGLVVDEAGAPVPGAWVAAYSSPFPLLDFEQDLAEILERPLDFDLTPLAATFADQEGRFELRGVPGRTLYLLARARARLTPRRVRILSRQLLEEDGVVLRTVPGAVLAGRVLGPDGAPVAGAEVLVGPGIKYLIAAFRNRSFFMDRARTDAAGRFEVPAVPAGMRLTVYAFAGGVRAAGGEFGPLPAHGTGEVSLRVAPMASLSGRVLDDAGKGLRGVQVVAVPLDLRQVLPFARDIPAWTARSGAEGRWAFPELPAATYLLLAQGRQGRAAPVTTPVTGPGAVAPDITIAPPLEVQGRVVDGEGRPVVGALVRLQSIPVAAGGGKSRRNRASFLLEAAQEILPEILPAATWDRTGAEGRFRLPAWRKARLRVEATGYPETDFDLEKLPEGKEPVLFLARPGAIEGVVVDGAQGRPVQFYLVRGKHQGAEPGTVPEVKEDEHLLQPRSSWRANVEASFLCDREDGRFRLHGLPPGSWTIIVEAEGYASASVEKVAVRSGETTRGVVVGLDAGAVVSGVVLDAATGAPVADATVTVGRGEESGFVAMLQGLERSTAMAQSAADGSFRVAGVESGADHVNVLADGYATASLKIPEVDAHEEREGVRVELGRGGTITGLVSDRHGMPLPGRMVGALSIQSRDFQQTATDADGRYRMEHMRPGSYFLLTAALDDDSLFTGNLAAMLTSSRIVTAWVQEGQETVVDIVDPAAGGCRLHGRILKEGRPLPEADLAAFGTERTGLLDFRMSMARSNVDGSFVFRNLAPGEYVLNVEAEGWRGRFLVDVPDLPEHYLVLEVPRTRVSGRVLAAGSGQPVPEASLVLVWEDPPDAGLSSLFGPTRERRTGRTEEDGRFTFEGLEPGRWHLEVTPARAPRDASAYAEDAAPLPPPLGRIRTPSFRLQDNEVKDLGELLLPLGGILEVRARDENGQLLATLFSVQLRSETEDPKEAAIRDQRSWGRKGVVRVTGLQPGRYELTAKAPGLVAVTIPEVEVRAGETTVREVVLARGATLKARVLDADNRPVAGARLALLDPEGRRVDSGGGFGALLALFAGSGDGAVPVGTFAPGAYTLRATWQDQVREVPVHLLAGQEQVVEIRF